MRTSTATLRIFCFKVSSHLIYTRMQLRINIEDNRPWDSYLYSTSSLCFQQILSGFSVFSSSFSSFALEASSATSLFRSVWLFLVQLVQSDDIELRLLKGLDLSDDSSAQWVDELASLQDELGELIDVVELSNEVNQVRLGSFLSDDFYNLLSDLLDLLLLSITGLSGLTSLSAGEGSDEDSKNVAILSFSFAVSINKGLPLSDELAELVSGHVHSMEVSHAGSSLNVFDAELDSSPSIIVVVQISKGSLNDSTLQGVRSDLCAGSLGNTGFAYESGEERCWGLDVVPFFSKERVLNLLLGTLLLA